MVFQKYIHSLSINEWIRKLHYFAKVLIAKGIWRIIKNEGLWEKVVFHKYIHPLSIDEWIRKPNKRSPHDSIMWRAHLKAFDVISSGILVEDW